METNQTHHGLMLSWGKWWEGHHRCFVEDLVGVFLVLFSVGVFFWSKSYDSSQKSLDNIHLGILHLFFTSCWYFRIILNTGNCSKCLRSLLKDHLASIPQVIPLEGFPASQEHPIENSKTAQRHQFPHKAHHLVICVRQALKEETPTSQTLNGRKEVTTSSPHPQHLTPALGREVVAADKALARNQGPVLQPLLLPHWRLGYGVMSPDQTLITLIHKTTKPLVPLSKAGTYCTVEDAEILTGCLFLPSWHGNKAQVCTWDKGRGHREKK